MANPIKVDGLAEFTHNLKKLDSDLPKMVRIALNEAADVIIDYARPRVPKRSGRAARSIRARSTQTVVRVSGGGNRAPYYPWLDFGGRVGRGRSVDRAFFKEGRYLYQGYYVAKRSGDFPDILSKALIAVARKAGLEVE